MRCFERRDLETSGLAKEFGQKLIDNTREVIGKPPMYKDGALHYHLVFLCSLTLFFLKLLSLLHHTQKLQRRPKSNSILKLSAKMSVNWKLMSRRWLAGTVSGAVNIQKVQDDVLKLWSVVKALPEISSDQKNRIKSLHEGVVRSLNNPDSSPCSAPHSRRSSSQFLRPQVTGVTAVTSLSSDKIPSLHLKCNLGI